MADVSVGTGLALEDIPCSFCGEEIPIATEIFSIDFGKLTHTIHISCMTGMGAIAVNYLALYSEEEREKLWEGVETI